mmetsp:Transcript_64921/g.103303  ORF Transcript_64921/g.103303 Transcript_64921/m.103303 type:complete len:123 (+) Transcript_64921:66-434(+)
MASLKYFVTFFLTLEVAAVRPAQHSLDLEKPTRAKQSHGHESKLASDRVEALDHADTEGKPCCGCKVTSFLGLGRKCDGVVGRYDMETCGGGSTCDGHFKMSGDEYSCWTKTSGCKPPSSLP